jgi:hypothetical protein
MSLRTSDSLVNTAHFPRFNSIGVLSPVEMRGIAFRERQWIAGKEGHRRHINTTMRTKRD